MRERQEADGRQLALEADGPDQRAEDGAGGDGAPRRAQAEQARERSQPERPARSVNPWHTLHSAPVHFRREPPDQPFAMTDEELARILLWRQRLEALGKLRRQRLSFGEDGRRDGATDGAGGQFDEQIAHGYVLLLFLAEGRSHPIPSILCREPRKTFAHYGKSLCIEMKHGRNLPVAALLGVAT